MSNRKIEPIIIKGKTIWVEVSEIDMGQPAEAPDHPKDLREGAEPTSIGEKVISVRDTLEAVVGAVSDGMEAASPDEWSVEVNLGFDGETKIPFLAEGGVKAGIKVSAKWKRADG